ncbi:uncharacterized protein LAJ45_08263 [Morchella importuna]|uniref:uncharacterized protein n=1 Tax=Morchella importuna TaxID=1174673 RepID=UPI001E8D9B3C|nr:uncharacterized protein LAJ45_08263 [Morchella importuna]KAH8147797.1 hypothetical protein LAJ45_08263 [Morchella importuna]
MRIDRDPRDPIAILSSTSMTGYGSGLGVVNASLTKKPQLGIKTGGVYFLDIRWLAKQKATASLGCSSPSYQVINCFKAGSTVLHIPLLPENLPRIFFTVKYYDCTDVSSVYLECHAWVNTTAGKTLNLRNHQSHKDAENSGHN